MKWKKVKQSGCVPSPRDHHSASVVGDKIVVFGGRHGVERECEVYILDTKNMRWEWPRISHEPDAPSQRAFHSSCVYKNSQLVIFGGSTPAYLNDVHILDTDKCKWTRANAKGPPPLPRAGHSAVMVSKYMFVFGGEKTKHERLNDVQALNLDNLTWSPVKTTNTPAGRRLHAAEFDGERMWVFGGETDTGLVNELWYLNIADLQWTQIHSRTEGPSPRASHQITMFSQQEFMLYSGFDGITDPSDAWVFDTASQQWKTVTLQGDRPPERSGYSMACVDSNMIMFGGYGNSRYFHDVWESHISGLMSSVKEDISCMFSAPLGKGLAPVRRPNKRYLLD